MGRCQSGGEPEGVLNPPGFAGGMRTTSLSPAPYRRISGGTNTRLTAIRGVRFLYIVWADPPFHGLGSQFHLMTAAMSVAMAHGRILVVKPASFSRADHDGCKGDVRGSLDCYFESLAKSECGVRAEELLARKSGVNFIERETSAKERSIALTSATPLVVFHWDCGRQHESYAAL